jgi:hypothetical protein
MRLCWLPGFALLLCGCGLGEYEARMLEAEQRMSRFEQESSLGPPLNMPRRANAQGEKHAIANAYLRAPKGISTNPANEDDPNGGLLYRYDPTAASAAGAFIQVEIAFGDTRPAFTTEILGLYPFPPNTAPRTTSAQLPGRPVVSYQSYEFDDNQYVYVVNIWRGEKAQVAIVYKLDKAKRGSKGVNEAMRASLATLALGADANARRAEGDRESPFHPGGKSQ